jgi:hypothetical protein
MTGVLENTGWVAGWVPNKTSQLGYVRETVKKIIVANWMIATGQQTGIIEPFLCTPENFHCIVLNEPSWPKKKYVPMKRKLAEIVDGVCVGKLLLFYLFF